MRVDNRKISEFTDIYAQYYPIVMCSIFSRVSNYDEAEDIAQEVFIRLLEKMESIIEPRKWIFGTMKFVTMEYYRRKGKNDEDIENYINDFSMNYINGFKDVRIIIEEAISHEPNFTDEKDKILFELTAIDGFSLKDAAEMTGYTYDKARYRYNKAVANIIGYLKSKGINSLEELL